MKRVVTFANYMMWMIFLVACNQKPASTNESSAQSNSSEIRISKAQFKAAAMELGNLQSHHFQQKVNAHGYITASPQGKAEVSVPVSGIIQNANLSVGQLVQKGSVLFSLDSEAIIRLQQEYAEISNRLKSLKGDYERQKLLMQDQVGSEKNLVSAQSEYLVMLAKSEGLKAHFRLLNLDPLKILEGEVTSELNVLSPITGYITEQNLVQGQYVQPNEMLMEIVNPDKLQLQLHVFDRDVMQLKSGQNVEFYSPDASLTAFNATLKWIGKSINKNTKTISCIAELKNEDKSRFVNGMYVECEIFTHEVDALAIPMSAVLTSETGSYVLVKTREDGEDYIFEKHVITRALENENFVAIKDSTLKNIVVKGTYLLSDLD